MNADLRKSALIRGLTQNNDDLFDEAMDCGKHLRAALDCHSSDDNQTEYKPGNETNE